MKQTNTMKAIETLPKKHRVKIKEYWSEAANGDGYWVVLKDEYIDTDFDPFNPTHTIHEWRMAPLLSRIRSAHKS